MQSALKQGLLEVPQLIDPSCDAGNYYHSRCERIGNEQVDDAMYSLEQATNKKS
jgi:hypothetical protein